METEIEITMRIKIAEKGNHLESEQRIKDAKVLKGEITDEILYILLDSYCLEMERDEFYKIGGKNE